MADIILMKVYKLPAIDWLGKDLVNENELRNNYIEAMKEADKGNFNFLFQCIKIT